MINVLLLNLDVPLATVSHIYHWWRGKNVMECNNIENHSNNNREALGRSMSFEVEQSLPSDFVISKVKSSLLTQSARSQLLFCSLFEDPAELSHMQQAASKCRLKTHTPEICTCVCAHLWVIPFISCCSLIHCTWKWHECCVEIIKMLPQMLCSNISRIWHDSYQLSL